MKICTITYHEVVDNPMHSGIQRDSALPYKLEIQEFQEHVNVFYNNNIVTEKIEKIDFNRQTGKSHIISFDDGGVSNLKAADILESKGLIGHFFITTGFIGKKGFLTPPQIIELHKRGHVIGAHSDTHPDVFYRLSYSQMLDEWKISKNKLETIIGDNVVCASVPGGEMNINTWDSSAESGLLYLFCSEPFIKPKMSKNWLIGRVCPKKGTDLRKIQNFVNFRGYNTEIGIRKIKNIVKRIYYPIIEKINK